MMQGLGRDPDHHRRAALVEDGGYLTSSSSGGSQRNSTTTGGDEVLGGVHPPGPRRWLSDTHMDSFAPCDVMVSTTNENAVALSPPPPPMPPMSPMTSAGPPGREFSDEGSWRAHPTAVSALAAMDKRLVTASMDGQVKLWSFSLPSGEHGNPEMAEIACGVVAEQVLEGPHTSLSAALLCCEFSHDGKAVYAGDVYGALHCWDLAAPHSARTDAAATGGEQEAASLHRFSFRCHTLPLTAIAVDRQDSCRLITASEDGTLAQWALPSPRVKRQSLGTAPRDRLLHGGTDAVLQLQARFVGHKAPVRACVLAPAVVMEDGSLQWNEGNSVLASGGDDGTCRLWDCGTATCLLVVTVCQPMSVAVCAVAVSSCGKYQVTPARCRVVALYWHPWVRHRSALNENAGVNTGRWLATADEAGWLHIFVLQSILIRSSATSDHAAARRCPNPTAGGINALSFRSLSERDAHDGGDHCGAHRLACDTGRVCSVFDVTPRSGGGVL